MQHTLGIIKPDAVRRGLTGEIIHRYELAGFTISAITKKHFDRSVFEAFYAIHKERPFFDELVSFMCSHPVVVLVLSADHAVDRNRQLMGATNPADAAPGTLRNDYALSIGENSVHGSDSDENAATEIQFFFPDFELNT